MFYPVNLQHSSNKHVFTSILEKVVDPDQMRWLCQKPADLDLKCFFKKKDKSRFSRTSV